MNNIIFSFHNLTSLNQIASNPFHFNQVYYLLNSAYLILSRLMLSSINSFKNCLKILYTNADGLPNKLNELKF